MRAIGMAFFLVLAACDGNWDVQPVDEPISPPGAQSAPGLQDRTAKGGPGDENRADLQVPVGSTAALVPPPGSSDANPGASCQALLQAGVTLSGVYWVINPTSADAAQVGLPVRVYCEQDFNGGGWALVYNSVLGASTLDFWNIPYAQRVGRRGRPSIDSNYYDGSLYQTGSAFYMDVIEDLRGKAGLMFVASSTGINNVNMRFKNPSLVGGFSHSYLVHFASGWSAPDYDGDNYTSGNCASHYNKVTQHYSNCWRYNVGSDADSSGGDNTDERLGPHIIDSDLDDFGFTGDGSHYSRVRAIRRYVKW